MLDLTTSSVTVIAIRQEYLETTIKWISKEKISKYMGEHQNE